MSIDSNYGLIVSTFLSNQRLGQRLALVLSLTTFCLLGCRIWLGEMTVDSFGRSRVDIKLETR